MCDTQHCRSRFQAPRSRVARLRFLPIRFTVQPSAVLQREDRMSSPAPTETPTGFDIYVDHTSRCVEVVGDLDLATVPLMVDAATSLRTGLPRDLTIDLAAVTFIDAAALGALVALSNVQQADGASLRVVGNVHVRRIADLCGLGSLQAT